MIKQSAELTTVMYHYVRPLRRTFYPEIKGLDYDAFEEQLNYLRSRFQPVSVDQVLEHVQGGEPLPERAVLLTFDDGFADHYTYVFPLLMRYGISGAFYPVAGNMEQHTVLDVHKLHYILASVTDAEFIDLIRAIRESLPQTGPTFEQYWDRLAKPNEWDRADVIFVKRMLQRELPEQLRAEIVDHLFRRFVTEDERAFAEQLYMTTEQMRLMTDCGMHFGLHGYTHRWLGSISAEEQEDELRRSKAYISSLYTQPDKVQMSIAYPYGDYNANTLMLCKRVGIHMGFTTVPGTAQLPYGVENPIGGGSNILETNRLDTNYFLPKNRSKLKNK